MAAETGLSPAPAPALDLELQMPADHYGPGDLFRLDLLVSNPGPGDLSGNPLFVVLDWHGIYFFAPGWTPVPTYYLRSFPVGTSAMNIIPELAWPEGLPPGSARFLAVFTDPSFQYMICEPSSREFSW